MSFTPELQSFVKFLRSNTRYAEETFLPHVRKLVRERFAKVRRTEVYEKYARLGIRYMPIAPFTDAQMMPDGTEGLGLPVAPELILPIFTEHKMFALRLANIMVLPDDNRWVVDLDYKDMVPVLDHMRSELPNTELDIDALRLGMNDPICEGLSCYFANGDFIVMMSRHVPTAANPFTIALLGNMDSEGNTRSCRYSFAGSTQFCDFIHSQIEDRAVFDYRKKLRKLRDQLILLGWHIKYETS